MDWPCYFSGPQPRISLWMARLLQLTELHLGVEKLSTFILRGLLSNLPFFVYLVLAPAALRTAFFLSSTASRDLSKSHPSRESKGEYCWRLAHRISQLVCDRRPQFFLRATFLFFLFLTSFSLFGNPFPFLSP
ncbi:hypothetical protein MPH_10285 [Macrophomina phaseolina MS6]|uniref:Transmembrane protein n=1 Tax=Macrophomina phaseolina (strain MS6) TaxID=1126212 RepID=K2RR13_MACPH|nr:hypothetical protein MPH_10285 [Macrophomina phaseolina MS6]